MSRAVLLKALRDAAVLALLLTLGVVLLEMAVVRALLEISKHLEDLRRWMELPLVRNLLHIALGADFAGDYTPTTLITFGLGHPLLYALSWTLLLTVGTGVIAGEIDRGTADLLLTLPVSRTAVYTSTSAVWVLCAGLVSFASLLGLYLGERVCPLSRPLQFAHIWPLTVNFYALNLAVGGVTMMVSSFLSRRAVAVGIVLAVLLFSDLINFLSQFWDRVRPFAFLGFLHYYRPLPVVRSGALPVQDILVLLGVGVVAWCVGLWYFRRRDIPAA
jgi:ABC-2 type transport system permease protein